MVKLGYFFQLDIRVFRVPLNCDHKFFCCCDYNILFKTWWIVITKHQIWCCNHNSKKLWSQTPTNQLSIMFELCSQSPHNSRALYLPVKQASPKWRRVMWVKLPNQSHHFLVGTFLNIPNIDLIYTFKFF